MQFFRQEDQDELKYYEAGRPIIEELGLQRDLFYAGAYENGAMGDMLFENALTPLTNAVTQQVFRTAFKEIFDAFVMGGSFESYLTVFRKIFGDDVDVEFTVPSPGQLNIEINAVGLELSDFVVRRIVDNQYVFDNVVDHEGNQIVFQTVKGIESEYELEQMLFELVPAGIFTQITLNFGG